MMSLSLFSIISDIFLFLNIEMFFGEFCFSKAFKHALITLFGLAVPSDLATISFIPRTSHTALTGPPAIIPVPLEADLNLILPAPSFPKISW